MYMDVKCSLFECAKAAQQNWSICWASYPYLTDRIYWIAGSVSVIIVMEGLSKNEEYFAWEYVYLSGRIWRVFIIMNF